MKKLIVLLLTLTLSVTNIYAAGNNKETDSGSKREQRKLKQQNKILRALDILQSGRFKFIAPRSYHDRFGKYGTGDWRGSCNISDPKYKVISTDIDTVKSIYTLVYSELGSNGEVKTITVEYNFKNGFLEAIERSRKSSRGIVTGNYSCIYALGEDPRK